MEIRKVAPRPLTGEGSVTGRDALRSNEPKAERTLWEQRVERMSPEQLTSNNFWDMRDRQDYRARHGKLPGERVAVAVGSVRVNGSH